MGSVGTQDTAPPPSPGQSERAFGSGSLNERTLEGRSAGRFGCSRLCRPYSAHGSPLGSGCPRLRSCQATATGGPRKRSIRRRIAANRARGTATSASWTRDSGRAARCGRRYSPASRAAWSGTTARPPWATPVSAGIWRGCRPGREAGAARRCSGRRGRSAPQPGATTFHGGDTVEH
jgi:hypothetical protein